MCRKSKQAFRKGTIMGLIASDNGKAFTPAPAGTHLAICCQVIDLGHQKSKFNDKVQHKILLCWELPDEKNESGEPFLVWNRYTLSLNEKANLTKDLEAWRGRKFTADELKGFDMKNILGKPCLLNIVHDVDDGKTWANIGAIMALPKGTKVPDLTHKLIHFDLDEFDQATFDTFSDNLKNTINASGERQKKDEKPETPTAWQAGEAMKDDDIPF